MFVSDYFKGINSFEYLDNYNLVTLDFTTKILEEVFDENKMVVSIAKGE